MGRPRKPVALRVLHGQEQPKKRRQPKKVFPNCPRTVTGEGRKHWQKVGKIMFKYGLLTETDMDAWEQYCCLWEMWTNARDKLKEEGEVLVSVKGMSYVNPWHHVYNSALKQIQRIQSQFGMTPAARASLQIKGGDDLDEFEQFLAQGG